MFKSENNFTCDRHKRSAGKLYLELYGEHFGQQEVYKWNGQALTIYNVNDLVALIKQADVDHTFDIKQWIEPDKHRLKFENYITEYLAHLEVRAARGDYSKRNHKNVKSLLTKHMGLFQGRDIRDIKRGLITKWRDSYSGTTDKQKNKCMKALRELLFWAYHNEDVEAPPKPMPFYHLDTDMPVAFDYDQQLLIVSKAKELDPRHFWILEFERLTGHRPSVIRALKVKDINYREGIYTTRRRFDGDTLREGLKSAKNKGRDYPLERVKHIIDGALNQPGRVYGPDSFIFMYQTKGKKTGGAWQPYKRDYLQRTFAKVCKAAGFTEGTNYSFSRHSMACDLSERGVSDADIAEVLDNSSGIVKKHYRKTSIKKLTNIHDIRDSGQEVFRHFPAKAKS